MTRRAFKMQLHPGNVEEYKKRHDELWPELAELLKGAGVEDYSIFLDEESLELFGVMSVTNETLMADLPNHPLMRKWWTYMKDIMASNKDHSPVSVPLKEVFHLA
ncbi:MAG: L-rhamnose mutarotase [Chitinophagaceae bacterium]